MAETVRIHRWYAGYAPGTEFRVVRRHLAAVITAVPVEQPFRGITLPLDEIARESFEKAAVEEESN